MSESTSAATPARSRKPFRPAFGKAALTLGAASMLSCCLFGAVITSLWGSEKFDPATITVVVVITHVLCILIGIAAVAFGGLSLAGFGKVDGESHRVSGAVGAIVGALMTVLLVWSLWAGLQLRRVQSEPWPFVAPSVGLTLQRPGPEWLLSIGEKARAAHPNAVAAAIEPPAGERSPRIEFALVEGLEGIDASDIDLHAFGELMAAESPLEDKQTELVELIELDGVPAVRHVVVGNAARKRTRQFFASAIRGSRCLHIVLIGDADDPRTSASTFDAILNGVELAELPEEDLDL